MALDKICFTQWGFKSYSESELILNSHQVSIVDNRISLWVAEVYKCSYNKEKNQVIGLNKNIARNITCWDEIRKID